MCFFTGLVSCHALVCMLNIPFSLFSAAPPCQFYVRWQWRQAAGPLFSDSQLSSELNEKLCLSVIHSSLPLSMGAVTEFKMLRPPVDLSADSKIDLPLNL